MFLNPAPSVKKFCDRLGTHVELSLPLRRFLLLFVMSIVVGRGKRSLADTGQVVVRGSRYRGQVSRAIRNRSFKTRDVFATASAEAIRTLGEDGRVKPRRKRRVWVVALDDVSTRRGAR